MATRYYTTNRLFPEHKQCSQCRIVKALADFYARKRSCDGKRSTCKECDRQSAIQWAKEHPKENRTKSALYRAKSPEKVEATRTRNYPKYAMSARTRVKQWRERHGRAEEFRKKRIKKAELRKLTIAHYTKGANRCACCGESRLEFLSFDHIDGGGAEHRRKEKISNLGLWLYRNNFPDGFRVLCYNCNCARGFLGYCPHDFRPDLPFMTWESPTIEDVQFNAS